MTGKHEKDHATQEEAEKPKKTVKPGSRRPVVLVAVILCSIIMVGSILLPSLAAIVSGVNNSKQQARAAAETAAAEAETADAATTDAATTEAADTATAQSTVLDNINSRYSGTVETLESKLSENPQDAATLINLANNYYQWASYAMRYASSDDEQQQVTDLLTKAEGYYDQYLALDDASTARASRAMCQFYLGDPTGALAALEELVSQDATFAPGWANLGLVYQALGNTDKATEAYNKALSSDPTNKYGLQSTVNSQLSSLTASTGSADPSSATTSGGSLADALASGTGK
ncbi:tetratricopeptide repeat protein [uncultured Parolsenella sp.]|uniref:tetratricopeptide repeat protein n=1 Tax=uncultured Parolsenella sp. TaxID=2083008 RepID=UPI0025CFE5EA|nr:tetratricopeptide repeat protein [uncultured Parolsenella sp.]